MRKLGWLCAILAGCANGTIEGGGGAWQDAIVDLHGESHSVTWTSVGPMGATGLVDDVRPFSVVAQLPEVRLEDARGEPTLVVDAGNRPAVSYLDSTGVWQSMPSSTETEGGEPPLGDLRESISDYPQTVGELASGPDPLALPLVLRALELGSPHGASAVAGVTSDDICFVDSTPCAAEADAVAGIGILVHECLDECIAVIVHHVLDCSQLPNALDCMDCCDRTWFGHYPSLRHCYIECGI